MVQQFEEAPRFQQTQMGVGMSLDDTTKNFVEKLIVDYGTSRGIKIALDVGVPAYAISMVLNTPIAQQAISGATGDAKTMLGDVKEGILGLFNVNQDPNLGLQQLQQGQAMLDPRVTREQQQAAGQLPEQQAIAQQQAETQQQIMNEISQANQQAQQTGGNFVSGPAGMGGLSSYNPTGFGSNIAGNVTIGKADGGLVSLFKKGF